MQLYPDFVELNMEPLGGSSGIMFPGLKIWLSCFIEIRLAILCNILGVFIFMFYDVQFIKQNSHVAICRASR